MWRRISDARLDQGALAVLLLIVGYAVLGVLTILFLPVNLLSRRCAARKAIRSEP